MKSNDKGVSQYLEEGLMAIIPVYCGGRGSTVIYTQDGKKRDSRSTSWLVKRLALHYSLDLASLRSRSREILGLRTHISLPFDVGTVLLPVKMRHALSPGETTTGYVNLLQVKGVERWTEKKGWGLREEGAAYSSSDCAHTGRSGAAQAEVNAKKSPAAKRKMTVEWKEDAAAEKEKDRTSDDDDWVEYLSVVLFKNGEELPVLNTPETMRERIRQGEEVLQDFLGRRKQDEPHTGVTLESMLQMIPSCNCIFKELLKKMISF